MFRFGYVALLIVLAGALLGLAIVGPWGWWIPAVVIAVVAAVGIYDLIQRKHSVLRNYPVVGHLRFLLEDLRPEIQQYFIEPNFDGRPFDRDVRSLIYERAKGTAAEMAFGTERDIDEIGYEYLVHSLKAYRSGARENAMMSPMAKPLTDKEIKDVAWYFSKQAGLVHKY